MLVVRILVAEDDPNAAQLLELGLREQGYDVDVVHGGVPAFARAASFEYDLILLDVGLPGRDGFDVCRRLRERGSSVPVLMITARDAVPDRVAGLDAGADDYLVKPFAAEELIARVRALLRRGREPDELLAHGDLTFDVRARNGSRAGRDLGLSAREADLLELLLRNRRQIVTRELALERVWGSPAAASLNVVDQYVSYLRAKLGEPPLIETVRGSGFLLR